MKTLMYAMILACSISTTWAAPPTPESIKRYMEVTQTDALMRQMLKQPIDFKSAVAQFEPDPAKQQAFLADTDLFLQRFEKNLDSQKLLLSIERVIANTFDQAEIDASIRFYETPEGQSILAKTPKLTQGMLESVMPVLNEALIKTMKQMPKK